VHRPISLTVAIEIYPASKHVSGRLMPELICVYCKEEFPLNNPKF
jgi:hypothetical protein